MRGSGSRVALCGGVPSGQRVTGWRVPIGWMRFQALKDGKWPTDPSKLGEEVLIGQGLVDFKKVFTKLHEFGYTGTITIERETSGPQQIEDVKNEKLYLQRILDEVLS